MSGALEICALVVLHKQHCATWYGGEGSPGRHASLLGGDAHVTWPSFSRTLRALRTTSSGSPSNSAARSGPSALLWNGSSSSTHCAAPRACLTALPGSVKAALATCSLGAVVWRPQ